MKDNISFNNHKIAIIGSGMVGTTIAYTLSLCCWVKDIFLIDVKISKIIGEVLDIRHGILSLPNVGISYGDYNICTDCNLIIISAGRGRRPNESRLDLINDNTEIIREIVSKIRPYYNGCPIIVVTNPVDILTYYICNMMQIYDGRIFGTGCILDSSRLTRMLADYLRISSDYVDAMVVGEHGDSQVPLWSKVSIGGISIGEYCKNTCSKWNRDKETIISDKLKKYGKDIITDKGSTFYGISECVCHLSKAILTDTTIIETVSAPLNNNNFYSSNVAISLPSIINGIGVVKQINVEVNDDEQQAICVSIEQVRKVIDSISIR